MNHTNDPSGIDPARWELLSPYLDVVLDLSDDERATWIASLREQNRALADDVQALVDEHRMLSAEGFLEQLPASPARRAAAGQTVGAYTLLSPLGAGGMGNVWLAERSDGRFERRVAIKLLAIAMSATAEQRFRREGGILARLTHPNIAQLVDAGVSATGQPYLVLEHVEGEHIDRYCDARGLDPSARVRLFLDVLDAVAHAHANLIVHRDLKPSNVLVSAGGGVKLLDFGIAKLLEDETGAGAATVLTREGAWALTPQYAAPEQVTGGPVTTATDIYTLGVLLYFLLTGRHPAQATLHSPADLMKAIVEQDPPRPSEVAADSRTRRALRGDLDTITLKAMKKAPHERYGSVTALADDLRRHLHREPIAARADSLAYRAVRFVQRNRAATILAALACAASVAGVVGTAIQARTARAQRDFALRHLARAEAINDLNDFLLRDAAPLGQSFTVSDLLARAERIVARQPDKTNTGRLETLIAMGRQYWALDQDAAAGRVLNEAYTLSRSLSDPSIRAKASCALGSLVGRGTDLQRAESLVDDGLRELGADPQYALERAFCLLRGAEVARESGAPQKSIQRVREAQTVLQASPIRSELVELRALADLAESYRIAGRQRDAAATFELAFPRLAALGRDDTQTAGTWLNNWGLALGQLGRPADAERILRRGIDVSRGEEGEGAVSPMLLNNYARVLREIGRLDEAADYAERAYAKATHDGDIVVVHQSLLLRGWIYVDQRQFDRAQAALDEVEPALRKKFQPGHIALAAVASYRSLLAQGRHDLPRALQLATEALDSTDATVKKGGPGTDALPILLVRRSSILLELGRADAAAADAARAVELLDKANPPGTLVSTSGRAYLALGRARHAQGNTGAARIAMQTAARHLTSALGPTHHDTIEARQY